MDEVGQLVGAERERLDDPPSCRAGLEPPGGGWDAWYGWAVPLADDLDDTDLGELRDEGLI
jgi:hypothetical protein